MKCTVHSHQTVFCFFLIITPSSGQDVYYNFLPGVEHTGILSKAWLDLKLCWLKRNTFLALQQGKDKSLQTKQEYDMSMHCLLGETINKRAPCEERMDTSCVCIQQPELFSIHLACWYFTLCFIQIAMVIVFSVNSTICHGQS